jgi:hypothetical protein
MRKLFRRNGRYRITIRHANGDREVVDELRFRGEPADALTVALERAATRLRLGDGETADVELAIEQI